MSDDALALPPLRSEIKLAEETFLTDDFLRQLINVGEVDVLVGLATHNNAKTIGAMVQSIQSCILRSYSRERVVIINADGGSRDGTPELVTGISIDDLRPVANLHSLRTLHSISTQYASSPSNTVALRTILAASELLRAKACICCLLNRPASTANGSQNFYTRFVTTASIWLRRPIAGTSLKDY